MDSNLIFMFGKFHQIMYFLWQGVKNYVMILLMLKIKEMEVIMSKLGIFMADGCEEIEGLAVVDVVRRAKMDIVTISITKSNTVTGSHNITFLTDTVFENVDFKELDGIILPGGMPGTLNLGSHSGVVSIIKEFAAAGKLVCAICAAPSVLGAAGVLAGKKATCHPGFEEKLTGASHCTDNVVTDGNIITSRGMGTAIDFGLAIVGYYNDASVVDDVKLHLVYK